MAPNGVPVCLILLTSYVAHLAPQHWRGSSSDIDHARKAARQRAVDIPYTNIICGDAEGAGWGLYGRDWGCCGSYDGCCILASSVCFVHDALCRCCRLGQLFCGPICAPDPDCPAHRLTTPLPDDITADDANYDVESPEVGENTSPVYSGDSEWKNDVTSFAMKSDVSVDDDVSGDLSVLYDVNRADKGSEGRNRTKAELISVESGVKALDKTEFDPAQNGFNPTFPHIPQAVSKNSAVSAYTASSQAGTVEGSQTAKTSSEGNINVGKTAGTSGTVKGEGASRPAWSDQVDFMLGDMVDEENSGDDVDFWRGWWW